MQEDDNETSTSRLPIVISGLQCTGSEQTIGECPDFQLGQTLPNCQHGSDVHLLCYNSGNTGKPDFAFAFDLLLMYSPYPYPLYPHCTSVFTGVQAYMPALPLQFLMCRLHRCSELTHTDARRRRGPVFLCPGAWLCLHLDEWLSALVACMRCCKLSQAHPASIPCFCDMMVELSHLRCNLPCRCEVGV